jgi:hypothetical protein
MGQTLFIILGVPRSGTSSISRAMRVFGARHGPHLLDPHETNPRGFWEDVEVLAIDEALLAANGGRWDRLGFVFDPEGVNPEALAARARCFLNDAAAAATPFAIKEPRMTRLLKFWQPLFEATGWDCRYIIALRNPISVAASLLQLQQMDGVQAALLWAEYLMNAVRHTAGTPRIVLDYDSLIVDPEGVIRAAGKALGVSGFDAAEMRDYCESFLTAELQHTTHDLNEVFASPDVPSPVAEFYARLLRCANGELDLESREIEASLEALDIVWDSITPVWRWLGRLDDAAARLNAQIAVRNSAIADVTADLAARDDQIARLTQHLMDRENEIAELTRIVAERDRSISQLTQLTAERDAQIASLAHQLGDQKTALETCERSLSARDALIAGIISTKSWKLTQPLRKLRAWQLKPRRAQTEL